MLQKKFDLEFFKYFSISFLASFVHLSTAWKNLPEPYLEQAVMKVCVKNFFLIIDLLAVAEPEIPLPPSIQTII